MSGKNLVVDDNPISHASLERTLRGQGFEVLLSGAGPSVSSSVPGWGEGFSRIPAFFDSDCYRIMRRSLDTA